MMRPLRKVSGSSKCRRWGATMPTESAGISLSGFAINSNADYIAGVQPQLLHQWVQQNNLQHFYAEENKQRRQVKPAHWRNDTPHAAVDRLKYLVNHQQNRIAAERRDKTRDHLNNQTEIINIE